MPKRPTTRHARTRDRSRRNTTRREAVGSAATRVHTAALEAERAREVEANERRRQVAIVRAALEFDETDKQIFLLVNQHPSITQEQIGTLVGLSRSAVNIRIGSDKFKRAQAETARAAAEIIIASKAKAARTLRTLLDSLDERVQLRAAALLLWPDLHRGPEGSGNDFVHFIQEAWELAEATEAAARQLTDQGGTHGSHKPDIETTAVVVDAAPD